MRLPSRSLERGLPTEEQTARASDAVGDGVAEDEVVGRFDPEPDVLRGPEHEVEGELSAASGLPA